MMKKPEKNEQNGFTLVELMIVVVVIAIVTSMAFSSSVRIGHRASVKNLSEDISGLITQTRITAMTSGSFVSLCPVSDINNAAPTCRDWTTLAASSANNNNGWVIFKDYNSDGVFDSDELVIYSQAFDDYGAKVGVASDTGQSVNVTYNRKGELRSGGRTLVVRSVLDNNFDRTVIVTAVSGRVRNVLAN